MFSRIVMICCLMILSACNLNSTPIAETPSATPATSQTNAPTLEVTQETSPTHETSQQDTLMPVATTPINPFEDLTHPMFTVASYYNAINLQDYARAYSYWEAVPNNATLEQYIAGFADTAHVEVIARLPGFEGVAAGSSYADVPVLITATHTDGTQESFIGCLLTHISNMPTGPEQNIFDTDWGLRGDVDQFGRTGLRSVPSTNPIQLETACEDIAANRINITDELTDQSSPPDTLLSYFSAISRGVFEQAYSYWNGGASFTLAEMQTRYANINPTTLYVNLTSVQGGVAAGSVYINMQVLVVGQNTANSLSACYVLRSSNVPAGDSAEPDSRWWLYSETIIAADLTNPQWVTPCP
jgi:hypothetical protein